MKLAKALLLVLGVGTVTLASASATKDDSDIDIDISGLNTPSEVATTNDDSGIMLDISGLKTPSEVIEEMNPTLRPGGRQLKRRRRKKGKPAPSDPFGPKKLKFGQCAKTRKNSFSKDTTCACQRDCKVFGDPYVKSFASNGKSFFVKRPKGVPKNALYDFKMVDKDGISIIGKVQNDYVKSVSWDGKEVAHVDKCKNGDHFKKVGKAWGKDYYVELSVLCSYHSPKEPIHLNTTITLTDYLDSSDGKMPDIEKDTTGKPEDDGYCFAQPKRRRGLGRRPRVGMNGRQCKCKASCAAYGDPHIISFGKKYGQDFLVKPETRDGLPQVDLYATPGLDISAVTGRGDRIEQVVIRTSKGDFVYKADQICNERSGDKSELSLGEIKFTKVSDHKTDPKKALSLVDPRITCQRKRKQIFFNVCLDVQVHNVDEAKDFRSAETFFNSEGVCFGRNKRP